MTGNRALAPSMIGRRDQLRELESYLQGAQGGAGQVVFLGGEAGVGKTRLIREFATAARAHGRAAILEGRCYDEDPAMPYGPFVDAIRAAVRESGAEVVAQACDPWTDDLVRLLPELETVASATLASDDPQIQKRRLFEAIYSLIRPHHPQTCRVVVLEDFHWSDQTSQELVHYLARTIARDRLLLIVSYRTDELHRRHPLTHLIAQLTRDRLYQEIRLAPLAPEELASMLETTLNQPLPGLFVDTLYDRTGGNPFFAEELLKSLIEHKQLDALIGAAQQGRAIDHLAIPISIKDSILERAADLDPTTAEVLTYAAVVGRRFDFDLLLRLTGLAEAALLRAVELLVERQLVVEDPSSLDDSYSFRHALTREAIYGDLLGRERRMRHREVLAALEELYDGRRDEVIDQLAYHSLHGRELEQAARYARLAGERAAGMYAYREAVAHYEAALDLLEADDPRERAELFASLGHAAYPLGDFSRCARYWREAQRLYEQLGDRRKVAELARWLGRIAWERDDPQAAFAHTRAAIEILEAEPPDRELAMAYSALSQLYMVSSQADDSIAWGEKALRLAEEFDDVGVKTHALNNIGVSLIQRGEAEHGVACLERSLELARQHGMSLDELRAYLNLSGDLFGLGQFRRAAELLREGVERARQMHVELYIAKMLEMLGQVEMRLGHWDRARELFERQSRRGAAQPHDDDCYPHMGELLLRQGRLDEARQLLESQLAAPERRDDAHASWPLLGSLIRVYLALGNVDRAVALLDERIVRQHTGMPAKVQDLLIVAVEAYLQAGWADRASELLVSIAALHSAAENPLTLARLEDGHGLLAAHEGRHADAAAHFGQAIERWRAMEAPYEEARARRRRAEGLLRLGDPAARAGALRDLAAARAIFERLGAARELEAADALARRYEPPPAVVRRGELTARERQVIALIAQGYSNRAIAETLVISEKTAEVHVGNILGKLGFSSRTQAAAYAVEHGLA
jgi:DNA-binding CsgD family transcriptional regulator/Tfp pilus assembly protein PilF